jgi:hypothetical protein
MYVAVFTRGATLPRESQRFQFSTKMGLAARDFTLVGPLRFNLRDAARDRQVCGDLVIHVPTLRIVQDKSWLWEWERQNPNCYAQRMMRKDLESGS